MDNVLARAKQSIAAGDVGEAGRLLEALDISSLPAGKRAERSFLAGLLARAQGRKQEALNALVRAATTVPHGPALLEIARLLGEAGLKAELGFLKRYVEGLCRTTPDLGREMEKVLSYCDERRNQLRVIAIHQPVFFPWLGFFHKVYAADAFCILDDAEWEKRSYYRRTGIRRPGGETGWLTVPVRKCSDYENQRNVRTSDDEKWRRKHLRMIESTYRKAAFFSEVFPLIKAIYNETADFDHVNDVNIHIIRRLLAYLDIRTPLVLASDLGIRAAKNERNIAIVKKLGGNAYYSGSQARAYNDAAEYKENKLAIFYEDFYHFLTFYGSRYEGFVNGLSAIDFLLHYGPDAAAQVLAGASDFLARSLNQETLNYFE